MKKTLVLIIAVIVFLPSKSSAPVFAGENTSTVVIINSRAIAPYNDAISGFKKELKESGYESSFRYYDFRKDTGPKVLDEIQDLRPDIIFTLGTRATLFAKENIKIFPIVFSMVLNPVESGVVESFSAGSDNLTGVSLDIPVETQFKKIKEFFPDLKRIGMLYDAERKAALKDEARAAAAKLRFDLVAKPVYSEADVVETLEEVLKEADCLWAGADSLVYNQESAKYILMATLRHKRPFMAFSWHYVKAGALFALECDYADIGRRAAKIAMRILGGEKPQAIRVDFPRKTRLAVNRRIAEIIETAIPSTILEQANEVY